jgi:hypothetical protein
VAALAGLRRTIIALIVIATMPWVTVIVSPFIAVGTGTGPYTMRILALHGSAPSDANRSKQSRGRMS